MLKKIKLFRKDAEGAVAMEFVIVAPILFLTIFGIMELGIIMLSLSTIESATITVTRDARVRNGEGNLESKIREEIRQKSGGLIDATNVIITTEIDQKYVDLRPETCQAQPTPSGGCPAGQFNDLNGNGVYDAEPPFDLAGAVIEIDVYYPYKILTPIMSNLLGDSNGLLVIRSHALIKNEVS